MTAEDNKPAVKLVDMSVEAVAPGGVLPGEDEVLAFVGAVAGECYGSDVSSAERCIKRAVNCIRRGHHSPFEHWSLTLRCTVDRGTAFALVRHRHCAFQQSSTIYQKDPAGSKDSLLVVRPPESDPYTGGDVPQVTDAELEEYSRLYALYRKLLDGGMPPARARDVLPNALAATLVITANIRELMYISERRRGPGDAPRTHLFCRLLEAALRERLPVTSREFWAWYGAHPL